jgi:hypothetical protein
MRCFRLFIPFILLFGPQGAYAMTGDVTTQGVVVVDTGNNPPETRIMHKFVQSVTTQPIRYVVITQKRERPISSFWFR